MLENNKPAKIQLKEKERLKKIILVTNLLSNVLVSYINKKNTNTELFENSFKKHIIELCELFDIETKKKMTLKEHIEKKVDKEVIKQFKSFKLENNL